MTASSATAAARFRDRNITFANGSVGQNIDIPSANPSNYYQAISRPADMPRVVIDGKLFLPPGRNGSDPLPLVIVTPGSLGVAASHLAHAEILTNVGIASFVLDPFGARGIGSTVANQTQFSFAASAYDVLAAWKVLSSRSEVDGRRIGAQGHSRGGSAVLSAATRRFADPAMGAGNGLRSVLAAYPWSGHQFLDPGVGTPRFAFSWAIVTSGARRCRCRAMRRRSDWRAGKQRYGSSPAPRTASIAARPCSASRRPRSRRRHRPATSPTTAPSSILSRASPSPQLVDRDLMVYGAQGRLRRQRRHDRQRGDEASLFRADMLEFWRRTLP